jgi:glycosyltransferase involved in cell wall biosynthesis
VKEVFPSVKQRFPEARLYVAGKNPPESVKALGGYSGVKVLGYVDDLRELIGRSEIVICPLRMATGLQTKIIEAMAMNKPIVSTRIGLGDLESKLESEDVVIADTKEEFIRELTELFSDRATLERVGRNGRRLVERDYGWEAFGETLNAVLDRSISNRLLPRSDTQRK